MRSTGPAGCGAASLAVVWFDAPQRWALFPVRLPFLSPFAPLRLTPLSFDPSTVGPLSLTPLSFDRVNELIVVGGGKMGAALVEGLLDAGWASPEQVAVVEVIASLDGASSWPRAAWLSATLAFK